MRVQIQFLNLQLGDGGKWKEKWHFESVSEKRTNNVGYVYLGRLGATYTYFIHHSVSDRAVYRSSVDIVYNKRREL